MAHRLAHYTCCLIVFAVFLDRGDGLWEKKDRENLQYDIQLFRKMADKIEHEIEDSYDEYSSRRLKEQIFDSLLRKYKNNIVSNYNNCKNITWHKVKSLDDSDFPADTYNVPNINGRKKASNDILSNGMSSNKNTLHNTEPDKVKGSRWPKFEDILLQIGKRYDWKNDRWLKVKVKLKDTKPEHNSENDVDVHEKHKFHYKIVKLNRSKSRRNVVVAVSAVR